MSFIYDNIKLYKKSILYKKVGFCMERSRKILEGCENQYYRATYKSMGFSSDDLKRPIIGIANAWSECVPGHFNLRQVAQRVKDGIYRAG